MTLVKAAEAVKESWDYGVLGTLSGHAERMDKEFAALKAALLHEADERRDLEILIRQVLRGKLEDAQGTAGQINWRRKAIDKKLDGK